jgi:outer membrane protein W
MRDSRGGHSFEVIERSAIVTDRQRQTKGRIVMKELKSSNLRLAVALGVAFLALQFAGVADATAQSDFSWIARGHYVHVWPGSDTVTFTPPGAPGGVTSDFWTDGGNGFNAELEYKFRPRFGAFFGLTFDNLKTNMSFNAGPNQILYSDDRVDMRQINLGGNYHFTSGGSLDIYAGVLVSWVGYSSSTFFFPEVDYDLQVKYDDELAWGINGGADFAFGESSPWFASVQVRYMLLALEGDSNVQHLTVDPVQGFFGFGYRW